MPNVTHRVVVIKSIIVWVEEGLHPGQTGQGVVSVLDGDEDSHHDDDHQDDPHDDADYQGHLGVRVGGIWRGHEGICRTSTCGRARPRGG